MYADKAEVFYPLIFPEEIRKKAEEPIPENLEHISLLTLARLSEEKGHLMIPGITRLLLQYGYNVNWYLIGEGNIKDEIYKEIEDNAVQDHVFLLGEKNNPYPYLKNSDIFVLPTEMEGYCTATNEARVLCKPVVTTDIPQMREQFINGNNGLLVEKTEEGFFKGIATLIDAPEMMKLFETELAKTVFDNEVELNKLYRIANE